VNCARSKGREEIPKCSDQYFEEHRVEVRAAAVNTEVPDRAKLQRTKMFCRRTLLTETSRGMRSTKKCKRKTPTIRIPALKEATTDGQPLEVRMDNGSQAVARKQRARILTSAST
jgi:hypothetical protein